MITKICEKCGWVLDIRDPKRRCPICDTRFKTGICTKCGEPVVFYREGGSVCKKCYDTKYRKPRDYWLLLERRRKLFRDWVDTIKQIPSSYPTLTEAQWLEAVKHFDGCAICGSESIDTRGYFISFEDGGRYCDWNIIPMCEECATAIRIVKNYFLWKRPKDLQKITDYLGERINDALTKSTSSSTESNCADDDSEHQNKPAAGET